jgi:radical SAM-linked protein
VRIRLEYTQFGKVRFMSHRDMATVWERIVRRAGLAVRYSEGFNPRPRLHFGLALSVGHESFCEYLDIDLEHPTDLAELPAVLTGLMPPGMEVTAVVEVWDRSQSLQQMVDLVVWSAELPSGAETPAVAQRVAELLAAETWSIDVVRKSKPTQIDLRSVVERLEFDTSAERAVLTAELRTTGRSVRPHELLEALGLDPLSVRVTRLHQYVQTPAGRLTPLQTLGSEYSESDGTSTVSAA